MKTQAECAVSAGAAMAAYVDDTKANTPEELGQIATLMLSTVAEGMVATLGRESTLQTLRMIHESVQLFTAHDGGPSSGGQRQ